MDAQDRVLFVNTFSKNWAMTGWRIGWITANPALGQVIENMVQYATSGVAQFMQKAAVTAIESRDPTTRLPERPGHTDNPILWNGRSGLYRAKHLVQIKNGRRAQFLLSQVANPGLFSSVHRLLSNTLQRLDRSHDGQYVTPIDTATLDFVAGANSGKFQCSNCVDPEISRPERNLQLAAIEKSSR